MNIFFRKITFLLTLVLTILASTQSGMGFANDEDEDIGMGGTGMLANTDSGYGLGGTGIIGEITGYGSIFVNGIEIEYDDETPFTINGKSAAPERLEIGDVVEVLTTDSKQHTQAQIINLRHEVIGVVESIEPQTYSFTVHGQSIVQSIDKTDLPEVGTSVAVAGFRIDEHTILSTRVIPAQTGATLLRTHTELPFISSTERWLIQTHVENGKAAFKHDGTVQAVVLKERTDKNRLAIEMLQLQKSASGGLELKQVIEPTSIQRGRRTLNKELPQGNRIMQKSMPGTVLMPHSNSMPTQTQPQPQPHKNKQRR